MKENFEGDITFETHYTLNFILRTIGTRYISFRILSAHIKFYSTFPLLIGSRSFVTATKSQSSLTEGNAGKLSAMVGTYVNELSAISSLKEMPHRNG